MLGVVLAGGQSSRFGSDKALAEIDGRTLLAIAVEQLSRWCGDVMVAGRDDAPVPTLPDWPRAGLGPLGGIAAALRLAQDKGCDAVLSVGVDSLCLPDDLLERLSPEPACLAAQPVVGLWPTSSFGVIRSILDGSGRHSMRAFAETIGARQVELDEPTANINTPADLASLTGRS
jgi:molybdopterin-guanine dinucleotide biosynthesis protein A